MLKRFSILMLLVLSIVAIPVNADDWGDNDWGDESEFLFDVDSARSLDLDEIDTFDNVLDTVTDDFRVPSEEFTLWKKTGGSRTRDPLFLVPGRRAVWDKNFVSSTFFFNRSNGLALTPHIVIGDSLIGYINKLLSDKDISEQLAKEAGPLLKLFPYLIKMTVQEHRIGTLLQAGFSWDRWFAQIDVPLLIAERNFWLEKKQDRHDLEQIVKDLKSLDGGSVKKIRYGLGDTKLKLGYNVVDKPRVGLRGGVAMIVPTSCLGHQQPRQIVKSRVGEEKTKLVDDLLAMSTQIMIDPPLGVGHWGSGCFMDFRVDIIPRALRLWGHFSYDHYLPGNERRLLPCEYSIPVGHFIDLGKKENATIPVDFPLADVFPQIATVRVFPGDIFNATIAVEGKLQRWSAALGYDFYLQQQEKIKRICVLELRSEYIRVEDGLASRIMQHKVFGEIGYTIPWKGRDIQLGLGGDYSFASKGAAKDWTVHAKVGIKF